MIQLTAIRQNTELGQVTFYHQPIWIRHDKILEIFKLREEGGSRICLEGVTSKELLVKETPPTIKDLIIEYEQSIRGK